jgi:hypothetical protein
MHTEAGLFLVLLLSAAQDGLPDVTVSQAEVE